MQAIDVLALPRSSIEKYSLAALECSVLLGLECEYLGTF
jgi:hypothetical protein